MSNAFLSLTEVGARLGRSPKTITRWIRRGVLPAAYLGTVPVVPRVALEALIAQVEREAVQGMVRSRQAARCAAEASAARQPAAP